MQNLVSIPCDNLGQMLPDALEAAIVDAKEQGKVITTDPITAGEFTHVPTDQATCTTTSVAAACAPSVAASEASDGTAAAGAILRGCHRRHDCLGRLRPLHTHRRHLQTAWRLVPCGWVRCSCSTHHSNCLPPSRCPVLDRPGAWQTAKGSCVLRRCWGAAALLSPQHRPLMAGSEQADSLAWNPHKLMGLPLQCSAFLTRHRGTHSA